MDMLQAFTLSPHAITFFFSSEEKERTGTPSVSVAYASLASSIGPASVLTPFVEIAGKDPVTGLTADEAVKLGADKFYARYTDRTKDYTTAGMRRPAEAFIELVTPRNERLAKLLPPVQREQYARAKALMNELARARYDADDAFGNGKDLPVVSSGDFMDATETLARMLPSLGAPAMTDPTARARAGKNLQVSDARYAGLVAEEKNAQSKQDYHAALLTINGLFSKAKTLSA